MEERISKKPVIIDDNGIKKLDRILLNSKTFQENWLQEILKEEPSILPTSSIDPIFSPLICIGREIEVSSGYIDNLYISPKGYIVIVETKLWRNPEARREVVGQIIDYAKDLKEWDYEKLDNTYKTYNKTNISIFDTLVNKNLQDKSNESSFIDITEKNIKNARFLLMIVGDGIREGVERMTEFLNETPNMQYRLALCELEVYDLGNNQRLVIPQLTMKTNVIERGIIRIEKETNNITVEMYKEEENKDTKKQSFTNLEEYITNAINLDNTIDKNQIKDLIIDIENLGFDISMSSRGFSVNYKPNGLKEKINLLHFQNTIIYFQPTEIFNKLDKLGFSKSIGEKLIEDLKPLLKENQKNKPYELLKGLYYIDLKNIIEEKENLLTSLESFTSNF